MARCRRSAGSRGRAGGCAVPGFVDAGDAARLRAARADAARRGPAGLVVARAARRAARRDGRAACGGRRARSSRRGSRRSRVARPRRPGAAGCRPARRSAHGMLWPISFSIAATALPSAGADDGDGGAGLAGAAGAADAVDVVVGVMRHVEIEDVADVGNVEAAGGDVGGDQQLDLAVAERVERGGARRLVQVAVQRRRR